MSLDIFGITDVGNTHKVFSAGETLLQVNNAILRRDGGNTTTDNIDLDSHKIVNAADLTDLQDVATKNYVDHKITHLPIKPTGILKATIKVYVDSQDNKKVLKTRDVMTRNLKLNIIG